MRALEGIRVLDLTRLAPGPFCTMILADMGADVIKVQEPGMVSGRRAEQGSNGSAEAFSAALQGLQSVHNPLHRNKKSITLNLKNEEARQIYFKLAEKADVVVEEFRPGVAKRLGIDYDTLKALNPRIIYCAITGYGQDGPYSQLPGHDINYISIAGALSLVGGKGSDPVIPLNFVGDYAGGSLHGVIGILLALVAREKTGKGQFVDISMTDGALSLLSLILFETFSSKQVPQRGEYYLSGFEPHYRTYRTKDNKYVSVGCMEPWFYVNLCRALGREDLIPLQNNPEKRNEIQAAFTEAFLTKTRDQWFELLSQKDTCVAPVNTVDELESDPHLKKRHMIVEIDHPTEGKIKQAGIPIKLSETPGEIRTLSPSIGQHTEEVLLEAGYSKARIAELRKAGAIG